MIIELIPNNDNFRKLFFTNVLIIVETCFLDLFLKK